MIFKSKDVEIFVPDGVMSPDCYNRTTHLAIAAHQDDIEIMAADGILKCFKSAEDWFGGVVLTDGVGSARTGMYSSCDDFRIKRIRALEQKKASYVGEYSVLFMLNNSSFKTKESDNKEIIDDIKEILIHTTPKVLYTHSLFDKHETHVATTIKVIQALRSLPSAHRPRKVYGCEVWGSLDWLVDEHKIVFDLRNHGNLLSSLVSLYDSQINDGKEYDTAIIGRRKANAIFHNTQDIREATSAAFAMDLSVLVQDEHIDIKEYAIKYIKEFKNDVSERLMKLY
jgi:LmbE family N-acetylglucosaminyl deacetylase